MRMAASWSGSALDPENKSVGVMLHALVRSSRIIPGNVTVD
jgi:hypothetical protein